MTDLTQFDTLSANMETGTEMKVRHPVTSEPIGVTLRVLGAQSDKIRKLQRRQMNARLKNQRKALTSEELEANANEVRSAAIVGWTWDEGVTLDGAQPEFSEQNVAQVLRRWAAFLPRQVDEHMEDAAAFMGN